MNPETAVTFTCSYFNQVVFAVLVFIRVHVKTTMFGAISRSKCLGSAVVVAVR